MGKLRIEPLAILILMSVAAGCVKPYVPKAIKGGTSYLVVDGTLAADSTTTITLTRTRNLGDTAAPAPELNAQVSIESESGTSYSFTSLADGRYQSASSSLDPASKYRLKIITSNGRQYLSDYVGVKSTPPIDSLSWDQKDDIFIYLSTHDPSNGTRYYRWDFTETSDYNVPFDSYIDFRDGHIVFLEPEEKRTTCYHTFYSTNILIGNSNGLAEDVINHQQINRIPNDNSKISDRYSIEVRQYALTADAYQYWSILKQNTEETGGLFDPQPSQLSGNIHCVDVPDEPVIGFVSASTVASTRIFINYTQLNDKKPTTYSQVCKETYIDPDSAAFYLQDGRYLPAYFVTNGPLAIAPKFCVDCRLQGGVTTKPSFW